MSKRFVLFGFLSGILIGGLIVAWAQAPQRGQGQRGPAAPCGPHIAGDLGKNTDPNSRCFELRMYTIDPSRDGQGQFKGGITELHKRFREGEVDVFKKLLSHTMNNLEIEVEEQIFQPQHGIYLHEH